MAAITATPEKLDIGRVFQGTFGVISRNFATFLVLSLVLGVLPSLAVNLAAGNYAPQALDPSRLLSRLWGISVGGLVAVLATSVMQGALVHATVSDLNGRRATLGECISTGLAHFLPLIGVGILFFLAIFAGMMLLIVPGLMVGIAFCVVSPIVVMERTGVFGAFSRSRALTRGSRWRIFGLILIYVILSSVVQGALGAAFAGFGVIPALVLVGALSSLIASMVGSTGIAVLYSELRRVREGVGANELAAVFD